MRKKESKEKAKAAMRANQGKAVKEDFDEELFKWEQMPFTQKFEVIFPFLVRNRTRYALSSYFCNKVIPF